MNLYLCRQKLCTPTGCVAAAHILASPLLRQCWNTWVTQARLAQKKSHAAFDEHIPDHDPSAAFAGACSTSIAASGPLGWAPQSGDCAIYFYKYCNGIPMAHLSKLYGYGLCKGKPFPPKYPPGNQNEMAFSKGGICQFPRGYSLKVLLYLHFKSIPEHGDFRACKISNLWMFHESCIRFLGHQATDKGVKSRHGRSFTIRLPENLHLPVLRKKSSYGSGSDAGYLNKAETGHTLDGIVIFQGYAAPGIQEFGYQVCDSKRMDDIKMYQISSNLYTP